MTPRTSRIHTHCFINLLPRLIYIIVYMVLSAKDCEDHCGEASQIPTRLAPCKLMTRWGLFRRHDWTDHRLENAKPCIAKQHPTPGDSRRRYFWPHHALSSCHQFAYYSKCHLRSHLLQKCVSRKIPSSSKSPYTPSPDAVSGLGRIGRG